MAHDYKENAVAPISHLTIGYPGLEFCDYPDTLGRGCSPGQTEEGINKGAFADGLIRKGWVEQISGPVWPLSWPAPTCCEGPQCAKLESSCG